ncbi:MAG: glycosyltransferase family 4 protein, partial [Rhodobacteraceae bacterium]|nr:glycosyltransferase family 4 protein [Paracoccaceae bacterium]
MTQPLRLGYLIPQFPGQTHIFFWREVAELEVMGVEVTLYSTRKPPTGLIAHNWSDEAMARTTYLGELSVRNAIGGLMRLPGLVSGDERRGLMRDLILSAPAAWRLVREAREKGISHVHVHSCGRAALVAALARRMGGPRYSLTLHGELSDYGPGQRMKWSGAAFCTVITEKLKGELVAELGDALPARLPIRPMGVDTEVLKRTTPYMAKAAGETLRLFSCARLNLFKGHQDLLQAVRHLIDQGQDVSLEIAGEDDDGGSGYRGELQALLNS